ncbi:MAG TPA: hypothetical protein VHE60_05775 [Pyrinomonadaceae bacterium]|nr:hypothetical protein [Pyrinomonadaceae bacterium]
MCKRLSAALLFVFLFAPVMNGYQGSEWSKVAPEGGGFSILMPAKPEEEVTPKEDFTLHLFTVVSANAIYLAGYGDYAPSIRLDPAGELAANRDSFLKGVNATLVDSKSIALDGRAGLEFTGESDQASFKGRVYLFGNRVHQISVAVFKGKDDTENVNRFFASFAFTKP